MDEIVFSWRSYPSDNSVKQDNVTNSTAANEYDMSEVNEYSHDTVYYSIHLIHSSGPAMDPPALNVSATGMVPEEEGGGKFAVSLPCTGKATAEVDFLLEVKSADTGRAI